MKDRTTVQRWPSGFGLQDSGSFKREVTNLATVPLLKCKKSFEKPKSNLKRWSKQLSQQAPQSINSCSSFTWLFCLCYPIKIPNPMDNPRVSSLLLPWHITCQWPSGPYDHGIQVYRILGSCITVNNCLEVHPNILTRPQTICQCEVLYSQIKFSTASGMHPASSILVIYNV